MCISQADSMENMIGFPDFIMDDDKLNERHKMVSKNRKLLMFKYVLHLKI